MSNISTVSYINDHVRCILDQHAAFSSLKQLSTVRHVVLL